MNVILKIDHLGLEDLVKVARFNYQVVLSEEAKESVNRAHNRITKIVNESRKVYGVNTGFGKLSDCLIENDKLSKLQENLLKSHACGVGKPLEKEVVRAMMLLRVNALIKGYSGIRLCVLEKIIELLNHDIIPVVPSQGSLGASGDLAPLAHMALPIIGLGEVEYDGQVMETKEALQKAGITWLEKLEAKEGLSLINGTQVMTAIGALAVYDAINISKLADVSLALTLEALYGIRCAFDEKIHKVRGQSGQIVSACNVRKLIENSEYVTTQGELRTQDPYTLRCASQVHGACLDAINYVQEKIVIEMNAATDNPLVFSEEEVISGGNFHGEPIALPMDFLKVALAELANISERRIERLVNPTLSEGLPPFLVKHSGINSGFMIVQYAAASLVSENKVLAHPASVDSIPSSGNQEDHVSMGTIGARGAKDILENTRKVLAMELFASTQALDLRPHRTLGKGTKIAYDYIRSHIPFIENDTLMYPYINKCIDLIKDNELITKIEKVIGRLDGNE